MCLRVPLRTQEMHNLFMQQDVSYTRDKCDFEDYLRLGVGVWCRNVSHSLKKFRVSAMGKISNRLIINWQGVAELIWSVVTVVFDWNLVYDSVIGWVTGNRGLIICRKCSCRWSFVYRGHTFWGEFHVAIFPVWCAVTRSNVRSMVMYLSILCFFRGVDISRICCWIGFSFFKAEVIAFCY